MRVDKDVVINVICAVVALGIFTGLLVYFIASGRGGYALDYELGVLKSSCTAEMYSTNKQACIRDEYK